MDCVSGSENAFVPDKMLVKSMGREDWNAAVLEFGNHKP